MTLTAAPAETGRRPQRPPSSGRFVAGLVAAAIAAAIAGSVAGSVAVAWGGLLGAVVFGILASLRVTRDRTDAAALVVAGAASSWWFGVVLEGRSGPIDLGLSVRAAACWLVLGTVVGWVVRKARPGLPVITVALIAVVWYVAAVAALQFGTAIGYLVELRQREIEAGVRQNLDPVFYSWTGMIVVITGLGAAFSIYVGTPTVFSIAGAFVMTVYSFNQIGFSFAEVFTSAGSLNDLAQEFWPPTWQWPRSIGQEPSNVIVDPMIETFQIGIVGATIGCSVALPLAFLASRVTAPTGWGYRLAKSFMNVIRTIPDLFWAIVFTAAVGFGQPLAGALAMIMFSLAIMAKLLSETVDAIDPGPMEAARSTGARHVEAIQYAALPQVLPNYVAYALYIFELNIRASVVIGIVGAGGIGRLLDEQRNLFQWDRVMAIVIVIFVAVILIEIVSITVRRRLV